MRTRPVHGGWHARAGFTLVELVISAGLASMILAASYLCLRAGFASQRTIQTRADIAQTARVALALMAADLRCATPLSPDFEFVGMSRTVEGVEAGNIDFATHNFTPRRRNEGDICEISYFLAKNPDTARMSLWRRRDPTPDPEPFSGGTRDEIAEDVLGLRFEYYDGFEWFDAWGDADGKSAGRSRSRGAWNLYGMPEAVRITLLFAEAGAANRPGSSAPADREEAGAPMAFQTVVRLNLAPRYRERGSEAGGETGS